MDVVPLAKVRRKPDKQYGKFVVECEINEIGEELKNYEIDTNLVNYIIPKHE